MRLNSTHIFYVFIYAIHYIYTIKPTVELLTFLYNLNLKTNTAEKTLKAKQNVRSGRNITSPGVYL